jgi:hypothetical protein
VGFIANLATRKWCVCVRCPNSPIELREARGSIIHADTFELLQEGKTPRTVAAVKIQNEPNAGLGACVGEAPGVHFGGRGLAGQFFDLSASAAALSRFSWSSLVSGAA